MKRDPLRKSAGRWPMAGSLIAAIVSMACTSVSPGPQRAPAPAAVTAAPDPPQKTIASYGRTSEGIPGARNVDHVGVVVPDLDEAIRFFVDVIGADLLWTAGPYMDPQHNAARFDIDPHTKSRVAMLRIGPSLNLELKEAEFPAQKSEMPGNADLGTPHLGFWVDDIEIASAYLESKGVRMLAGPFLTAGEPKLGEEIRYFITPFGMYMELVHRPARLNYEKQTPARLFGPAESWKSNRPWADRKE